MAALTLAALLFAAQPEPREQQWVWREQQGDGQPLPHAIFLSWDFGHVIFHASCSREAPDTLELRYFPDHGIGTRDESGHVVLDPVPPIVLKRGTASLTLRTGLLWDSIVGRARIDPALLALLRPSENGLGIAAVNETGDDWDVGQAEPLYRLALACDDAQR